MGARPPHTVITGRSRHSNKKQPPPYRGPSLPCATSKTTDARQAHPPRPALRSVRFRLEIGPAQPGQPDVEARTTSSRAKATCRTSEPSESSRPVETRPISTRKWTDLAAECDRSRCGDGPISRRRWTDLAAEMDRSRAGVRPISAKGCAGAVRAGQGQGRPGSGPARGGRGQWLSGLSRAIRSASRS